MASKRYWTISEVADQFGVNQSLSKKLNIFGTLAWVNGDLDIPGDSNVQSIKITAAVARGDAKPLIVRKADKAAA